MTSIPTEPGKQADTDAEIPAGNLTYFKRKNSAARYSGVPIKGA